MTLALLGGVLLVAESAHAQAAPKLVSSAPANNATGVAVASRTVTFVFDTAMLPNDALDGVPGFFTGALKWSANLSEGFEYGWSSDSKTLTCTYSSDFPANATVTWALNPPDVFEGLDLRSLTGVALPKNTYSGSFQTGAAGGGGDPGGGGGDPGGVPELVSSTPVNGATAVSVTSTVRFVFNVPMVPNPQVGGVPPFVKGALAWTGAGLNATKFTYAWSADGKTLTCTYAGSLPGNTTISWELNPADAAFTLDSAEGETLPAGLYKGSFTTAEGSGGPNPDDCNANGFPDDWGTFNLNKSASYEQASAADPVPASSAAFSFGAGVSSGSAGPAVTAASVTAPGKAELNMQGFAGMFFSAGTYSTEAALDAAYAAGRYTLEFTRTGESERTIIMTVPANSVPVPKVSNFAEAQAVNEAQAFTLRWNGFSGASALNDFQSISIYDGPTLVFQAPDPCVPRDLAVTANSIVIPAGTLQRGKTYQASLTYAREFYLSTNAIPNMAGFGAISRITQFPMAATGGVVASDPARFVAFRLLPNGSRELVLTGTPNRAYTVERAGNLSSPVWRAAGVATMDATGRATVTDAESPLFPMFYRAVAN